MTKIDLTGLANLKGYGNAAMELYKAGLWDEDVPGMKKYIVNVTGTVEVSEAVIVTADNKNDAETKAKRNSSINDVDSIEIIGVMPE